MNSLGLYPVHRDGYVIAGVHYEHSQNVTARTAIRGNRGELEAGGAGIAREMDI